MTTITNFGLCSLGNGQLLLPVSITNDAVKSTIGGIIRGPSNIDVVNGGIFELTGTGRSGNLAGKDYINTMNSQRSWKLCIPRKLQCMVGFFFALNY